MLVCIHFSTECLKAYQLGLFGGETHIPEKGRMPRRQKQQLTRVAITDAKGRSTHVWKAAPKPKHEPPKAQEAPRPPPQDPAGHHAVALVDLLKKHGRVQNPKIRQSRSGKFTVQADDGGLVNIDSEGQVTGDHSNPHVAKAFGEQTLQRWFGMRTYSAPIHEWRSGHAERISRAKAGHQVQLPPRPPPITDEDRESARAAQALSDAMRGRRSTGPRLLPGQTHTPHRAGG